MKFLLSVCTLFLFAFTTTTAAAELSTDPIGKWKMVVKDVPDMGDVKSTMTISKTDDGYSISLSSDIGAADLEKVVLKDGKLTGQIDMQGVLLKLSGSFDGDSFSGRWESEYGAFPVTAEKE